MTEANNLRHLGEGLNKLCGDKDDKAALTKILRLRVRREGRSLALMETIA